MTLAKVGARFEEYVLNPALKNATFFGWWLIESTATNTGGTTLTDFVEYTLGVQGGSSNSLSGCLLKGNNLSDLLDAGLARTNIGLDTTANQTDSVDKRFMSDAQETKLNNIENLADVTDTQNVTLAGALMASAVVNLSQVKAFDSTDYLASGTVTITGIQAQNILNNNAKISFDSISSTRLANTAGLNTGDQDLSVYLLNTTDTLTGNLTVTGDVTATDGLFSENLDVGLNSSTETRSLTIGGGRTANGNSFIDLVGDATYNDYGLRIIRNGQGANANSELVHRGTGNFVLNALESSSLIFKTSGSERLTISNTGAATFASTVKAGGYKSSDGTAGITTSFNPNSIDELIFKNGILVEVNSF